MKRFLAWSAAIVAAVSAGGVVLYFSYSPYAAFCAAVVVGTLAVLLVRAKRRDDRANNDELN